MIDEKKLIEEIQRQINIEHKKCNEFVALNVGDLVEKYNHGEYCYVNVLHLVQSQPKVGEWIPCSEKLPIGEEYKKKFEDEWFYKKVLTTEEGKMHIGLYDQEDECWYDVQGFIMYPVAWQPLPTPYNAKRGGKNESR